MFIHIWYVFIIGKLRHPETKGKWPLCSSQGTLYKGAEVLVTPVRNVDNHFRNLTGKGKWMPAQALGIRNWGFQSPKLLLGKWGWFQSSYGTCDWSRGVLRGSCEAAAHVLWSRVQTTCQVIPGKRSRRQSFRWKDYQSNDLLLIHLSWKVGGFWTRGS